MRRGTALLALAAALASVPAAAQQANGYEAGVAARKAGNSAEAKRLLVDWLATHPDDVDARLNLGYSELALGNFDAAQRAFEGVLKRAPDYAEARDGIALVAQRRVGGPENRGFIALEGALSDLTGSAPDWHEVTLDGEAPLGTAATLGGRASYYRRFGLEDIELVARAGLHPSDNLWLRGHVGGTPDADFRPEFEIGGGFDVRVAKGDATVLSLDADYQRFPVQEVVSLFPGLTQYFSGGKSWVTLRGIGTIADGGPLEVGGLVRGDYVPIEGWRLFAGVSNGPDTELGTVTRVTGLFVGLEAPLGQRLALTGAISHDNRETGPDRTEFRLGLKARF